MNKLTLDVYNLIKSSVGELGVETIASHLGAPLPRVRVECERLRKGFHIAEIGAGAFGVLPTCKAFAYTAPPEPTRPAGESAEVTEALGSANAHLGRETTPEDEQWALETARMAAKLLGLTKLGSATIVNMFERFAALGVNRSNLSPEEAADQWLDWRVQEAANAAESRAR